MGTASLAHGGEVIKTDQGDTALLSRLRQRPPESLQHLVTPELFDQLRRVA